MVHSSEQKAGPCLIIPAEGIAALKIAAETLDRNLPAPKTIPFGRPLSLFFYSHIAPGYVQIRSIQREESLVTINYQIVTHASAAATTHYALIPLGPLPDGKFRVDIKELPPPTPYVFQSVADDAVCDSSTFIIKRGEER
ncbi:hypothetical protein OAS39_10225 [Pirellulales bacterium]|nr:hypothetical protein [Pirellulales bacterium]